VLENDVRARRAAIFSPADDPVTKLEPIRKKKSRKTVAHNTSGLKRGGPGRPKGVPNKVTVEAKAAAGALVDDPIYREQLALDVQARKVAPAIEQMLWHYAKGKPKEIVELHKRRDVTDYDLMTDEELKARLRALLE
jgi:hypothetical protein